MEEVAIQIQPVGCANVQLVKRVLIAELIYLMKYLTASKVIAKIMEFVG
jgi:hypothetical protein